MKIHFWMHNPRNVSKKPHAFAIGEVSRIETIVINASNNYIKIEGVLFSSKSELTAIAINDGFRNWQEMKEFFPRNVTFLQVTFHRKIWRMLIKDYILEFVLEVIVLKWRDLIWEVRELSHNQNSILRKEVSN